MGKIISGFTMSLDGFIAGPNDDISQLFKWYYSGDTPFPLPNTDKVFKMSSASAELFQDYFRTTGAFVTGRRDFDVSRAWGGYPPFGVPTFIVTHNVPREWVREGSPFIFVPEGVTRAIDQAKRAAGDRNVVVSGAQITQQCLKASLLDEIHIELASMLLGDGISLFGQLGIDPIALERFQVIEGTDVTHLKFRVIK